MNEEQATNAIKLLYELLAEQNGLKVEVAITKEEQRATGEGIDIPLVVLVNENSASASEVLAGAIKDRGCGTLIRKWGF